MPNSFVHPAALESWWPKFRLIRALDNSTRFGFCLSGINESPAHRPLAESKRPRWHGSRGQLTYIITRTRDAVGLGSVIVRSFCQGMHHHHRRRRHLLVNAVKTRGLEGPRRFLLESVRFGSNAIERTVSRPRWSVIIRETISSSYSWLSRARSRFCLARYFPSFARENARVKASHKRSSSNDGKRSSTAVLFDYSKRWVEYYDLFSRY